MDAATWNLKSWSQKLTTIIIAEETRTGYSSLRVSKKLLGKFKGHDIILNWGQFVLDNYDHNWLKEKCLILCSFKTPAKIRSYLYTDTKLYLCLMSFPYSY